MANQGSYFHRSSSTTRLSARRAGIDIDLPKPHLPVTEQEETDIM
jgi:hypothetical protein